MATPTRVLDVELTPMARQARVTYVHDVFLDAGEELAVGDRIMLRDEGGALWHATVIEREEVRLGHKWRLQIQPSAAT